MLLRLTIPLLQQEHVAQLGPGNPDTRVSRRKRVSEPPDRVAIQGLRPGHYDVCEALFTRVLAMHGRIYGGGHPKVAEDLIDLGATQMERGHYQESEKFDRQALAIAEKFYGPFHPETATRLTQLGRSLQHEQRYDEARLLRCERFARPRHRAR